MPCHFQIFIAAVESVDVCKHVNPCKSMDLRACHLVSSVTAFLYCSYSHCINNKLVQSERKFFSTLVCESEVKVNHFIIILSVELPEEVLANSGKAVTEQRFARASVGAYQHWPAVVLTRLA